MASVLQGAPRSFFDLLADPTPVLCFILSSQASIKFLKTGEVPEDQILDILPPDEVKDCATRRRLLRFFCTSGNHDAHSFSNVAVVASVVIVVCATALRNRRGQGMAHDT